MPYLDREKQREFQRRWVARRRAQFFDGKLCEKCGSKNQLELHHLDPDQKESHRIWSWAWPRILAEVAKCVVWCRDCHVEYHANGKRSHGIGGYQRGCRCHSCKSAKADQGWREKQRKGRPI